MNRSLSVNKGNTQRRGGPTPSPAVQFYEALLRSPVPLPFGEGLGVRSLRVLWEKKLPTRLSNVLFLTEEHRWTEYTAFHRDIKSTDFTEPYSQKKASPPAPLRMERGVITEIPLYVLRRLNSPSPPITRPVGVTSHTTPLAIRRGAGGEASVISVCRRRSVGSKQCAKRFC